MQEATALYFAKHGVTFGPEHVESFQATTAKTATEIPNGFVQMGSAFFEGFYRGVECDSLLHLSVPLRLLSLSYLISDTVP